MPVPDHVLHAFELADDGLRVGDRLRPARPGSGALSGDAVLVKLVLGEPGTVLAHFEEQPQSLGNRISIRGDAKVLFGSAQASAQFGGGLFIERLFQLAEAFGAVFDQDMQQLRLAGRGLRNSQATQGGDLNIKLELRPAFLRRRFKVLSNFF